MDTAAPMQERAHAQFGELLERHRGIVFKVAHTYCRHPDDRADLVQEIAAQLWRSFPAYDPKRSFSTWMYRVALNVAISTARSRQQREQHSVPLEEIPHEAAIDDADHEAAQRLRLLQRFLARTDPLNRALLLLYLDERSHREIAEILGLSEGNVATKVSRLKQRIRDGLA